MTPYLIHALEVQCDGLAVEVWLNGLRVFRESEGREIFAARILNPSLVDGENTFEVRAARVGALAPSLKVVVARTDGASQDVPAEDVLVRYEWKSDEQPLEGPPLQSLLARRVDVGPAHGPWAWQGATPYVDTDRAAVEAAVAELHGALARRDVQGVVDRMQVKTAEMARGLDGEPSFYEGDLRQWLGELFGQDDWHMEPLDPSLLELEPSAAGRLVVVSNVRGGAPLSGRGSESVFEPDELTYSHLDGGWTLVR
jgi:hypothetical protein